MPLKCTVFIWLIFQDALPTNACRFHRGMVEDPTCGVCSANEDTTLHCLRECSLARAIWRRMGFDTEGDSFSILDVKDWLRALIFISDPLAIATLWWVWRARCIWCLEHKMLPVQVISANIDAMRHDLVKAFVPAIDAPRPPPRLVKWEPILDYGVVLNVDGSVRGVPSRGGFGGCFRSIQGQWQGGFFGFLEETCILRLELLAIFQGLSMAWERGYRVVDCQSDSMDAVNLVMSVPPTRHLYVSLIWDIKDLLARDWLVDIHHILREGNACADFLAKHGAGQDQEFVSIDQPSPDLGLLLLADASGVAFERP